MKLKRVSFSSRAVVDDPFEWAYELEDIGYTGWEIVQEGSQCLSDDNLPAVKDIMETTDLELTLHLPFSDMNLAGLNPGIHREVMRQMKNSLELASSLVELAVVHPGYLSPYGAQLPEKAWNRNIESIRSLCDLALDFGITIAIENMPDYPGVFGTDPQKMLEILESVDRENAGLTFDVGHANTVGIVDDFLEMYKGSVSHVHIHDNMGKKDEHLPVGKGSINWRKVMDKLSDHRGIFVTEMGSLDEGIESLAFLKGL